MYACQYSAYNKVCRNNYLISDFVRKLFPRSLGKLVVVLEVVAVDAFDVARQIHVSHQKRLKGGEMVTVDGVWLGEETWVGDDVGIVVYQYAAVLWTVARFNCVSEQCPEVSVSYVHAHHCLDATH